MKRNLMFALIVLTPLSVFAAGSVVPQMLQEYQAQGAASFSAERGKAMWNETHMQKDLGQPVSCASCHGSDLGKPGKHAKTGKLIEPLSPRANPERLTDTAKIEKWFGRNCNWTLGRACTAQEKGDFLTYIQNN